MVNKDLLVVHDERLALACHNRLKQAFVPVLDLVAELDEELDVASDRMIGVREQDGDAGSQFPSLEVSFHAYTSSADVAIPVVHIVPSEDRVEQISPRD